MSKSKSRTDFICRVRFRNTLPDLPFPPKLLTTSSPLDRYAEYQTTSLETQTPYSLDLDKQHELGSMEKIIIEYLDAKESDANALNETEIPEEDYIFLLDPQQSFSGKQANKPNISWLRRIDASVEKRPVHVRRATAPKKAAAPTLQSLPEEYRTHEGQLHAVENTFNLHTKDLQHPKTKAKAKRITPVLPDMECWENVYTIVQFEANPADAKRRAARKQKAAAGQPLLSDEDIVSRGILRPISNPHNPNDNYLIWFLPDDRATDKLMQQKTNHASLGGETLTYHAVRDYAYANDNSPGQHMLLTLRDDGTGRPAYLYNITKSRMATHKKRKSQMTLTMMDEDEDYEKPNVLNITFEDGSN